MSGEMPTNSGQFEQEIPTDTSETGQLEAENTPETISEETIENTLRDLYNGGVLSNMRAEVQGDMKFFDPKMGYILEHDLTEAGIVLDTFREALKEGDKVARKGIYFQDEVDNVVTALEPGGISRRILMAYWLMNEDTPWRTAKGQILGSQSHRRDNFPSSQDVKAVFSRVN